MLKPSSRENGHQSFPLIGEIGWKEHTKSSSGSPPGRSASTPTRKPMTDKRDHHIEPEFHDMMNNLARGLDEIFNGPVRPKKTGFMLLMFKFGEPGRANYISNARIEDGVKVLEEY